MFPWLDIADREQGAALLAKEEFENTGKETSFRGFNLVEKEYRTRGFECEDCPNHCEVVEIFIENELVARWEDRCGKWSLSYVCKWFEYNKGTIKSRFSALFKGQ